MNLNLIEALVILDHLMIILNQIINAMKINNNHSQNLNLK